MNIGLDAKSCEAFTRGFNAGIKLGSEKLKEKLLEKIKDRNDDSEIIILMSLYHDIENEEVHV